MIDQPSYSFYKEKKKLLRPRVHCYLADFSESFKVFKIVFLQHKSWPILHGFFKVFSSNNNKNNIEILKQNKIINMKK